MRDQFIAGLASETLRVKLIGKGHRHRDVSQTKVTLKEVVETAKCFEATTYANQLMKTARAIKNRWTTQASQKLERKCTSNRHLVMFARHGIPDECISDNGPQFDSYEYSRFARDYGFNLVKSSPYYSRGNGKAESVVKIAKNILKKSRHEDPYLALLAYRNTPQQGHAYSPAQRLMSRRLRDLIPMATSQLRPQTASPRVVVQDIVGRRQRSKMQYDKKASTLQREFSPGRKYL